MEALAVIWAPIRTLANVAEERRVLLGFGVVALYAALSLIGGVLAVLFLFPRALSRAEGLPPGFEAFLASIEVFSLVYAVVAPFVLWLLVSGLMHLVTRFFGGTGPFSGMLAVVGVAQAPLVINAIVGLPLVGLQAVLLPENPTLVDPEAVSPAATIVQWLSFLIGLAFLIWHAALVVIGAAFARRVGYGQSAGSCAISCAGVVGLILIVVVGLIVLAALLVGVASPDGAS